MPTETAIDPPRRLTARLAPVRESEVEAYLVERWGALGGRAYKWSSPGLVGVPDRLLFHPAFCGRVVAVECKAPGKKPTEKQAKVLLDLEGAGVQTYVVDSVASVNQLITTLVALYQIPVF